MRIRMKLFPFLVANGLLAGFAAAWEHVIPGRLQSIVGMNEYVMIACKQ
jgi:hypothetical protein